MKIIRPFSELDQPKDISLGTALFRLKDALKRKQLVAVESIILAIPKCVEVEHVEWLLACFLEFISIMIEQYDCERTKGYVDKFSKTVMEYSISEEEKAAFYLSLANTFFAHSAPHSRYLGSEYAAHYIHTSFLYHPLDYNDPRVLLLDTIEKAFFLNITEGKGQPIDEFEAKWKFFREALHRLRRETREKLFLVNPRQTLAITGIRHEFNAGIRSLIASIADEMLRRLISFSKPFLCDFTLLGVGSVALSYFTALSDIDIALLVSKKIGRENEHFQNFIRLLSFELICMGEEQSENLKHQKIAGMCIDPANRSLLLGKDDNGYSSLIDTPEAMAIRWFFRRDNDQDILSNEANEMLRTVALYSSSEAIDLAVPYQQFFSARRDGFSQEDSLHALDKHMANIKNKLIEFCEKISEKNKELISVTRIIFDFKEVLVRPLLLWISDVAFIFGNTTASLDGFFTTLSESGFVDSIFIERLRFGLEYLWKLKFELEYDGKFVNTGQDFSIDYDNLSDDEQQMINELIETLIVPLSCSAKNIIHQVLIYRTYTKLSFDRRMDWYQKIKNDLVVSNESDFKEVILRTFDINAPFMINPLISDTKKISTYALSSNVFEQLIVREADDLVYLDDQAISDNRPDFLPLTIREGKLAYWLSCLPTPGYHDGLFADFSNLYTHAIGNSQIIMLQLCGLKLPCLLIERRQNNQSSIVSLSDEIWTILLLRALLLDSDGRAKQAQLIYCLEQMTQVGRLDRFVLKRFFDLKGVVITDWYAQLNMMNEVCTALDVPAELISIEQEEFLELATRLNERYEILREIILGRNSVTGIDLLASVDPVSVYYYQHSFTQSPVVDAQTRYRSISAAIGLEKKQYVRGRSLSSLRPVVGQTADIKLRLLDAVNKAVRYAARNELELLPDCEKYKVITGFFQEDFLSKEPGKREKQIGYMAKAFALVFPIVSEPLKQYMTVEEFALFNQKVSEFRQTPVSTEPSPEPKSPTNRQARNIKQEELAQLNQMILSETLILDKNAYGQTVLHLAAKHGNAAMVNDLLNKISNAKKLDIIHQGNNAGWTFLHYIIEHGDPSWNESTWKELFSYLGSDTAKIIAAPNMYGSTPFHMMTYNSNKRWNATDLALFLDYLGDQAGSLLCMRGRRGFTPIHYITRNKSKHWDISVLVDALTRLDSSEKKVLIEMLDEDGWSPLHYLARSKYRLWEKEALSLLFDGVDALSVQSAIMFRGFQDWTPFHLAIYYHTAEVVKIMFDFLGANAIAILTRNGEDCVSHIKFAKANTIDKDAMVKLVTEWKFVLPSIPPLPIDPEPDSLRVTEEKLGEGVFSIVFKGRYRNQDVAVKQYKCDRLPERTLDEAQKELSVMEQLGQHPNIVGLFGFENSSPPRMILEYCSGGSLYYFLHSEQDIDWGLRLRISLDIASGLAYVHEKNVVHADIKSYNVLLTEKKCAKLADFGLSKIRNHARSSSTQLGSSEARGGGTINWKAPELFGGRNNPSKSQKTSDIWAFGMVLFEIANRALPFADAADNDEMKDWIKEGDGEKLPEEGYPEAPKFAELMKRCWGKDITKRITANEAVVILQESMCEVTGITPSSEEASTGTGWSGSEFETTETDEKLNEKYGLPRTQGYVRYEVAPDGECGYTAFGIIRKDAMQLLLHNIHDVSNIIKTPVRHALLTNEFYEYLYHQNKIFVGREYLWKQERLLKQHVDDLIIQEAYILYDVQDKSIDAGYSHPAILQALAHIQHIEIHLWRLGENDVLVPHDTLEGNYAYYKPSGARDRVDLLFVNGNHFERLEILGYGDDIPNKGIYPLTPSWNQHVDVHTKDKKQSNQVVSAKAKMVDNMIVTSFDDLLIDKTKLKIFENNRLGEGAAGVVYKGTYGFQLVAVKRYLGNCLLEKDIKNIQHELRVMYALRHECLVRLLGFVHEENGPGMIVMEYAANGSLYKYLRGSQAISWSVRLRIAEELARGLAYLHQENVIHRDIKSLNVVLDGGLHAKLCDFGLATLKVHSQNSFQASQRNSKEIVSELVGTCRWMAPETMCDGLFSRASDIWALGMVYFELASRQVPYQSLAQDIQIMYRLSQYQAETVPTQCRFEVPQFATLMERCWAQRTQERPTAAQLVEELGCLIGIGSSEASLISSTLSISSMGYKSS